MVMIHVFKEGLKNLAEHKVLKGIHYEDTSLLTKDITTTIIEDPFSENVTTYGTIHIKSTMWAM